MYTENEIKEWFDLMMKKYKNSPMEGHMKSARDLMFDDFWKADNIKTVVEKRAKS